MSKNPIKPFWSWNDKLEAAELTEQIENMQKAGIEGFFMHARGGLITEYMGEDWFEMVENCLDTADKLGMDAWAYDENGWPSGFANGIVPSNGLDYQQKWLECETINDINILPEHALGFYCIENGVSRMLSSPEEGCTVIYIGVNKYYIDTFNTAAIRCFLDNVHEKYYEKFGERFGSSLKGFFTDEPQYGNNKRPPWSQVFSGSYLERFGEEILPELPKLFFNIKGCEAFRARFYNMAGELFRASFMKQMYDWCSDHNCKLTGHMMNEESLLDQMSSTSGVMACYEYFHEPGIDWLCRHIKSPLTPKQLGSAAYQLGRKTLTESFALCGWDVSLNELKWIAQWQFVHGVTSLCPHLEGYTLRGCRKRDYPASLFTQLPWFEDAYPTFSDYMVKLGEKLDSGEDIAPLLVIHPLQSAYIKYNPFDLDVMFKYDERVAEMLSELAGEHILHHYGDESFMEKNCEISGDEISVGKCSYKAVLLPELDNIKASTAALLLSFAKSGGSIYALSYAPKFIDGEKTDLLDALCAKIKVIEKISELRDESWANFASISTDDQQNRSISYCRKNMPDGTALYYLVNLSKQNQNVSFEIDGEYTLFENEISSEKLIPIACTYIGGKTVAELEFAEYSSFVITAKEGKSEQKSGIISEKLELKDKFEITACSENCLTLDFCEYSINGGEWQSEIAVISLQGKLLAMQQDCDISMRFSFEVEAGAEVKSLSLCTETPEKFSFEINGEPISFNDNGYFTDKSIRKCNIFDKVRTGKNTIIMSGKFHQNDNVYKVLFTPGVHEVERNKLTYDTELESIYLIGDFAVKSLDDYTLGEKKSVFTGKSFMLTTRNNGVDFRNITACGYPFFAGQMALSQSVSVAKKENTRYIVELSKLHSPAAELYVNDKKAGTFAFAPFAIDVTEYLLNGENEITIKLLSGNRNLLGPHHHPVGELHVVSPQSFMGEGDCWLNHNGPSWTDNYSFVLFGFEL